MLSSDTLRQRTNEKLTAAAQITNPPGTGKTRDLGLMAWRTVVWLSRFRNFGRILAAVFLFHCARILMNEVPDGSVFLGSVHCPSHLSILFLLSAARLILDDWFMNRGRWLVAQSSRTTIPNEQSSVNPGSSVRLGHKTLRTFMKRSSL